jgi:hypothetical protein
MMLQHQKVIWIRFDVKYDKDINLSEKLSRLKNIYIIIIFILLP